LGASEFDSNGRAVGFHLRRQHVQWIEWISHFQRPLQYLSEAVKRRAAYKLGLMPHHQQWTEVLNMALASAPVHRCQGHVGCPKELERSRWPQLDTAIDALERTIPAMRREFDAAHQAGMAREHGEGIHLKGMWDLIHMGCAGFIVTSPEGLGENAGERGMFPNTCQALRDFEKATTQGQTLRPIDAEGRKAPHPHIQEARFATLHPGTVVGLHTSSTNQRIKVHCGIRNPSRIPIQIANASLIWEEGRCILIDDSYEHKLSSPQEAHRRTILELKISHPDLNHAHLLDNEEGMIIVEASGNVRPLAARARGEAGEDEDGEDEL